MWASFALLQVGECRRSSSLQSLLPWQVLSRPLVRPVRVLSALDTVRVQ